MTGIICDFCSCPNPTWRYPAKTFRATAISESNGEWAACTICHDFIEADDRAALLRYSTQQFAVVHPEFKVQELPVDQPDSVIGLFHNMFFLNREGPALPLTIPPPRSPVRGGLWQLIQIREALSAAKARTREDGSFVLTGDALQPFLGVVADLNDVLVTDGAFCWIDGQPKRIIDLLPGDPANRSIVIF